MTNDVVLRAITKDGAFRVITARTTGSARGVTEAQRTTGNTTKVLAELLTGTILMREAMAPDLRVQGLLQLGSGRIVADAYPGGATRALVQGQGPMDATRGVLQMMRSLHNGSVQQGIVEVSGGDMSTALMEYMQSSEQVASFVSVATVIGDDGVVSAAGGYLVQLLPEVGRAPLMVMTERLADFAPLATLLADGKGDPEELMTELLYAMPYEIVGKSTVRYECPCDDTRVAASLASLPKQDIREILADGKVLEIQCDYCRREYRFAPEKLRGLLAQS